MPAYPNTYILHMKASITVLLAYDIVVEPKKMFFAKILPKQLKHECSCTPRKPLSRFRGAYTLDLFWCSDPAMWGLGKGGDRKSWRTIKKQTIALKIQSFILALFWRFWPESTSKSAFTWSLYLGWTWRYRFLSQHGPVWRHFPLFCQDFKIQQFLSPLCRYLPFFRLWEKPFCIPSSWWKNSCFIRQSKISLGGFCEYAHTKHQVRKTRVHVSKTMSCCL